MLFDILDVERTLAPDRVIHRHGLYATGSVPEPVDGAGEGNLVIKGKALQIAAWQDQCFLVEGAQWVLDKAYGAPTGPAARQKAGTPAKSGLNSRGNRPARWSDLIAIDVNEDPGIIINRLSGAGAGESAKSEFFKLTPAQLSHLVPKIRLFLVKYKTKDNLKPSETAELKYDKTVEISFDAHTKERTVLKMMQKGHGRAYGAGLKSFEYEFDGKDPATSEKSIKARMEILLTSFDQLTEKQRGGGKIIDLLLRAPKMIPRYDVEAAKSASNVLEFCRAPTLARDVTREGASLTLNPKYRRIKAVVGWAAPTETVGLDGKLFNKKPAQDN